MPFAGYQDFQDCVDSNQDKDDPKGYCATIMRNVEGESMNAKKIKEKLNWISDITLEQLQEGEQPKDFARIRGLAIKARESRNGVEYLMDELSKAKPTLIDKTIALNHSENAEDVVGIIDNVVETGDGLEYEGRVYNTGKHPYVIGMLQNGLIRHVSIEALSPRLEEKDGKKIARDLEFLGMAFVRHPGIPEASVSFAEALEKITIVEEINEPVKEDMMSDHKCEMGMHWDDKMGKCMPDDDGGEDDASMEKMKKDHEALLKLQSYMNDLQKQIIEIKTDIHEISSQRVLRDSSKK